jgi:hypothetical protein
MYKVGWKLMFLTPLFLLSACGGGAGGGDGNGGGGGKDPLAIYRDISASYTGIKTDATLTSGNIGQFLDALLIAAPELLGEFTFSESFACQEGGSFNIKDTNDAKQKVMVLSNCRDEGVTINGELAVLIDRYNSSNQIEAATFVFKDVSLQNDTETYKVRGTLFQEDLYASTQCNLISNSRFNLLLSQNQQQVWLNNLSVSIRGSNSYSCDENPGLSVNGKVYLSDYGQVNINTTENFTFRRWAPLDKGFLTLQGVNAMEWSGQADTSAAKAVSQHRLTLRLANSTDTLVLRLPANSITAQMITDWGDDDKDGMLNGYELAMGFSPANPADASADSDMDGFTNLEEFLNLGSPKNNAVRPLMTDLTLVVLNQRFRYEENMSSQINLNWTYPQEPGTIVLEGEIAAPLKFKQHRIFTYCDIAAGQRFRCELPANRGLNRGWAAIQFETTGHVLEEINTTLTLKVSSTMVDTNPDNNILNTEIQRLQIQMSPSMKDHSNVSDLPKPEQPLSQDMIAVLGEEREYDLSIDFNPYNNPPEGELKLDIPQQVSLVSLSCFSEEKQDFLACERILTSQSSNRFRIRLKAEQEGAAMLRFGVLVNPALSTEPLVQYSIPVVTGRSTEALQQQIDTAADQAVITVPDGIYIGKLDLSQRPVTLRGVAQKAHFYQPKEIGLFTADLDKTTIQTTATLKLGSGSSIEGVSLSNHLITVEESGAVLRDNQLGNLQLKMARNELFAYGPLVFEQNRLEHKSADVELIFQVGSFNSYMSCSTFYLRGPTDGVAYDAVFRNNLYTTPEYCRFVYAEPGVAVTFEHNTTLGLLNLLTVDQFSQPTLGAGIVVRNNLIRNVPRPFTLYALASAGLVNNQLQNNLYDGVTELPVSEFITETGAIFAENSATDAGELQPGSAAIDAALASGITTDLNGRLRPVDGNADKIAEADIGAFELQP